MTKTNVEKINRKSVRLFWFAFSIFEIRHSLAIGH
jgi:hypothetical protein